MENRDGYSWENIANLFLRVTVFLYVDCSHLSSNSNLSFAVTCQNQFAIPPHQYPSLLKILEM